MFVSSSVLFCMLLCCRRCSIGARSCKACMQLAGAAAGRAVLRRMTIRPSSVARNSRLQRGLSWAQASHIPLDHAWLCLCVLIVRYPATSGCRPAGRGCAMSRAGPGAWPAFGSPGCVRGASRTSYLPDQVTSSFRYLIQRVFSSLEF